MTQRNLLHALLGVGIGFCRKQKNTLHGCGGPIQATRWLVVTPVPLQEVWMPCLHDQQQELSPGNAIGVYVNMQHLLLCHS